jgi:hypothetical protein
MDNNVDISYFSETRKITQNIISVLNKTEQTNNEITKEILIYILKKLEKQNDINESLIKEFYNNISLTNSSDNILVGMFCIVNGNNTKKVGKIEEINEDNSYTIRIIGEDKKIKVTREKFNL